MKNKGQAERDIHQKKEQLKILQLEEEHPDGEQIQSLQQEANGLIEQEEMHWRQWAKEHWLKNGDRNSKFFHASVTQRRRANKISCIEDEAGASCSTSKEIARAFTRYFQNLFNTSQPSGVQDYVADLQHRVTPSMNDQLVRDFTVEEFHQAMAQMGPLKSPGSDGLPVCFYQDNWATIGEEVCTVLKNFSI